MKIMPPEECQEIYLKNREIKNREEIERILLQLQQGGSALSNNTFLVDMFNKEGYFTELYEPYITRVFHPPLTDELFHKQLPTYKITFNV
jgi:hypothetical protein